MDWWSSGSSQNMTLTKMNNVAWDQSGFSVAESKAFKAAHFLAGGFGVDPSEREMMEAYAQAGEEAYHQQEGWCEEAKNGVFRGREQAY